MRNSCLLFVALCLGGIGAKAQVNNSLGEKQPKLVVGITVEQMRPEFIDKFWDTFQEDGFKRLVNHGAVCQNARIDIHNLKASTGMATISTGVYPSVHGIVGDRWYKQLSQKFVSSVYDSYYMTVGSDSDEGNCSAIQLKVPTVGDALKRCSNNKGKVFSVALNANSAVLAAGHSADGAFWLDRKTGNFISSSYYYDKFPVWVQDFNKQGISSLYLDRQWELLLPIASYNKGVEDGYLLEKGFWGKYNTFPYNTKKLLENTEYKYDLLKATPFGNKLVRDFAANLIEYEKLGEDEVPDLLLVSFSTLDFANKWFEPVSVEIQDLYVRLDQDIASLLAFLDKKMGRGNYLVYLTAPTTMAYSSGYLKEELNFPAGQFSPQTAMALLRAYLNAVYGVGDWLLEYNEEQVYLNHQFIEKKEKSLPEIQTTVAEFLNQFEGVKSAIPACVIEKANLDNNRFRLIENSYCVQRSGDVILQLDEGWQPVYKYSSVGYTTDNLVPLIFYGMQVKPGHISRPVPIVDVVPTISRYLGISPPDDASGNVIDELFW